MSSEIVTTTGEIPTTSSEPVQVVNVSPNGSLNPNAVSFNNFSLMTLSDKSPGPETSPLGTSKLQQNADSPQSPLSSNSATMVDSLQYSPEVVNGYGPYSSPGASPDDVSPKSPANDLRTLLRHQLEYYFSRENLARDTYLVSQMDKDNYVPIWTVANFNQVKKLTTDLELVKEVLRESPHLQVDPLCEKVRANVKRCIVVLREIPEKTPLEEVEALFSGEGCPRSTGCEFVNNDYWYIQFDSEDSAQRAYRYLREEVKTFHGKPIMARIKAKPIHQSNFVPKNAAARVSPSQTQTQQPPVVEQPVAPPTPPQASMFNQRHFQFPPVPPMFNGQQPFPYYAAPAMMTWPPGHAVYREPHTSPGFPNNGFGHGPLKGPRELPGSNAVRHGFQMNRTRFQNKPHHRDQTSNDRPERESGNRTRPQSANGTSNHNSLNSSPTTSSPSNSSSTSTSSTSSTNRDSTMVKSSGPFRTKETRESDEFSRRTGPRPIRRRRGSSEDIRRDTRQKENRASPVRHSKDDSDTLDLAPSHFPPLPTSPLAATKQPVLLAKDFPEMKSVKPPPTAAEKVADKAPVSPLPSPTQAKQEATPAPKPVEKAPKPVEKPKEKPKEPVIKKETKPAAPKQEDTPAVPTKVPSGPRPAERLSYAQMAAAKGPKPTPSPPVNIQTKSPGK